LQISERQTSGGFSLDVQAAGFLKDARDDTATKSRHHSPGWVNQLVRNHQRALSAEVSFTIRTDRGSRKQSRSALPLPGRAGRKRPADHGRRNIVPMYFVVECTTMTGQRCRAAF
jgi:hypothetical protein